MTSQDRRRFLKLAAATAGAAAAGTLPPSIARALAIPPARRTGTLADVEHVVILMQENRSFDHYFGSLRGVRGFADPRPLPRPDGKPVWYQADGKGADLLPFHPDAADLGLQFIEDLPHGWNDTHAAFDRGRHDGWVPAKGSTCMAYLKREDIPFHYALADAFTVCDAYHCSILSSTDPNRYYMWSGCVGNDGAGGGPVLDNAERGYGWTTYPERLEQAGVSWKIYQDIGSGLDAAGSWGWTSNPYIGNYGDNSLLYFDQYRDARPGSPLYEKARTGTRAAAGEGFFDRLRADVLAGKLPQVSWIAAPEAYTEHPNWPANYGAWYVSRVLDALTAEPEVWSRTVLLLTYDENDGFFDHAVPPFPPASREQGLSTVSTAGEFYAGGGGFDAGVYGLGIRVPMLAISPWSRGGWVCSQTFDHTSIIRFLERRFGVREPNISAWRRAVSGDLTSAFDFAGGGRDERPPRLPDTAAYAPPDRERHADYRPAPPATPSLPAQEPGLRPARSLPYALDVRGRAEIGSGRYWLDFANRGQAGAAFLVTAGNRGDGPWTYTVEAGKQLSDYWTSSVSDNRYALAAHGPNGFLREFRGSQPQPHDPARALPEVELHEGGDPNRLWLRLGNHGDRPCTFTVRANDYAHEPPRHYRVAPGDSADDLWDIAASAHWYDLLVTVDTDAEFLRRLAGHRETGKPSLSDPALGRERG
jgi:phospholipase C